MINCVSVFCASRFDAHKQFESSYHTALSYLIDQDIQIAYGGANDGYMGLLADIVIEKGGYLIGCMPRYFDDLGRHEARCHRFYSVDSIAQRLTVLANLSQGFIAFPGGLGTLEEIAVMLSYNAIGLIQKPVALLNIDGYFDPIIEQYQIGKALGYIQETIQEYLIVSDSIEEILEKMKTYHETRIEYIDGYNAQGQRVVTNINRFQRDERYYYKSVFLLLIDADNRLLIQKRASNKTYGGLWDFSVTGAVAALEEGYQGMMRETLEELGLLFNFDTPDQTIWDREHIMEIYVKRLTEPIEIVAVEQDIDEIRWVDKNTLLEMFHQKQFIQHEWRLEVIHRLW